jgi:hypothetical protein
MLTDTWAAAADKLIVARAAAATHWNLIIEGLLFCFLLFCV